MVLCLVQMTSITKQEEERKRFLSTLVHDLRAPLRRVNQLGAWALEEYENGNLDDAKDMLSQQTNTTRRANELITALEAFALLEQGVALAPVSLASAAEQAADNLASLVSERNAQVSIEALSDVLGIEPRLVQLFQNLIQNGLKYNENEAPTVNIRTETATTGFVGVVVEDNGIGIEQKYLESIFTTLKRLWTADKYEGTGLGLATCQKTVKHHRGKIWCTSTAGQGTSFHIVIPLSETA